MSKLADNLNAEIVLGTITNRDEAGLYRDLLPSFPQNFLDYTTVSKTVVYRTQTVIKLKAFYC